MGTAIILSFLSGVAGTLCRIINAQLAQRIGALGSTFCNYALGLLCSILILLIEYAFLPAWDSIGISVPAWAYLCGLIGVLFVVLSNIIAPKMSAFSMTLLIIVGQLSTGIVLDVLIHHQFHWSRMAGSVLIFLGLLRNLMIDRDKRQIQT
ncbi:DMT family transporter [Leptolyngbya ohadii]|uniref:DMT family transporter n=1 Tax=Leptolyngbya ohadii TaxID=1962290 RepID=UPI0015C634E8|nr:DMT family transporter [Leptolyngbya ohadii]